MLQIVGYSPSLVDQIWVDDLTQVLRHSVPQVLKVLTEVVKIEGLLCKASCLKRRKEIKCFVCFYTFPPDRYLTNYLNLVIPCARASTTTATMRENFMTADWIRPAQHITFGEQCV